MDFKNKHRIYLSIFFFLSGFCFSSWASRIPTLKIKFDYDEAELGTILLTMPVSSLLGLPISGWLISRYDSRIPLSAAFIVSTICLFGISFADSTFTLVLAIGMFAFSMRILTISLNTQAITLQKLFSKKIMGGISWTLEYGRDCRSRLFYYFSGFKSFDTTSFINSICRYFVNCFIFI